MKFKDFSKIIGYSTLVALISCSTKRDEIIFSGTSSKGSIILTKIVKPLASDDLSLKVTGKDTTYTFYDFSGDLSIENSYDTLTIATKSDTVLIGNGYVLVNNNKFTYGNFDDLVIDHSKKLIREKYDPLYGSILKEILDSVKTDLH